MELRQLEYFMVLSRELHFTKAADRLGITQPTLSHQIKALEDEIGMPLFDRLGKKIAITEAGFILAEQCKTIFSALDYAKDQINELQQVRGGSISIAALPGELTDLVSTLLFDFHKNYPDVKVRIISSDEITELILLNEIDFGVTIATADNTAGDERIRSIPLYEDEFFLVVSHDHPLATREDVRFSELTSLPLILFPESHQCRKLLNQTCVSIQSDLHPKIETSSIDTLFEFVKSGLGLTVVSKTLLDLHMYNDLISIPIVQPRMNREVSLVYRRDKFIGYGARNFIQLLTTEIIKLRFPMSEDSKQQIERLTSR
ncbi:LysR family transcriptional regulator [Brevibacillus reuszeri]|uniref:LysR family transcriptional regulator n=1 Tax=Brevibacillus reuszeri TaxID=54915 RepID=UPI0028A1CD28|nr:LysR family transcriptional regulator [Brevibacillus reuszeri]